MSKWLTWVERDDDEREREELHVSTHPSAQAKAKAKAKAKAGLGLCNIHTIDCDHFCVEGWHLMVLIGKGILEAIYQKLVIP